MQQNFDIRVISLIDQQDRRERVQQLFKDTNIAWQFLDAVSGKNLENYWHHYDQAQRLKTLGYDMRNNEIACFLSHRIAWQQCVENNKPMLVLEDDIKINPTFQSIAATIPTIHQLLPELKEHFFVRVGRVNEREHIFIKKINDTQLVRCLKDPMSTIAYLVTPQIAQSLLAHSEKFSLPVDNFLWQGWRHGCHLLDIVPQICFTNEDETPSTIGTRQKPSISPCKKVSREYYRFMQKTKDYFYQKKILKKLNIS